MKSEFISFLAALGVVFVVSFAISGFVNFVNDQDKTCAVTYSSGKEVHVLIGEWK